MEDWMEDFFVLFRYYLYATAWHVARRIENGTDKLHLCIVREWHTERSTDEQWARGICVHAGVRNISNHKYTKY